MNPDSNKRVNLWITAAWLVHAVSWFCHVEKDGVRLPDGLPGWEAFTVALSPVWDWSDWRQDNWYWCILHIASAVACAAFVLASWYVAIEPSPARRRKFAWWALSAFLLNTHWLSFGFDLRIGYYLWCLSFLLLAIGLFTSSPREAARAKENPGAHSGVLEEKVLQ